MRKLKVGSIEMPVVFTTWTVNEFHKLTGINLYDQSGLLKVFKKYSDEESVTPADFEVVVKLAYCALASAEMPETADEDWKPPFTWRGIMNKLPMNDSSIYGDLLSAYFDRDVDIVLEAAKDEAILTEKNVEAPNAGRKSTTKV